MGGVGVTVTASVMERETRIKFKLKEGVDTEKS